MFPNSRFFLAKSHSRNPMISFICILSMTILCLLFQMRYASAAEMTLQWDDNNVPGTVAGYYAYCGTSTGSYQITQDIKNGTKCTFTNLQEGAIYHFAVKGYSSTGVQSDYSDELVFLVPKTIDTVTDSDGDGISDYDEINTYHTDPQSADTDNDGLNDGDELALWGSSWNGDNDNDSIINLLDNDSDNDGYSDGLEIKSGTDPGNKTSVPSISFDISGQKLHIGSSMKEADNQPRDLSGGGYTGTLVNDPVWVSHSAGNPALHFDGIQSYVDTGFDEHLINWTVTAWVKGDNAPDSTKDAGPIMKQKNYMMTWDHTNDTFRGAATVCVGGKWYAASFGALEPNVWYYLTATYDGETLRAFKDGQLITENPDPSGPADDSPYTAKIGRHARDDQYFAGTVDDVKIFDYSLAEDEVATLYEDGIAALSEDDPVSDTVAYWRLNEGSGQSTADLSGGGYTGTLVNDPVWVSHSAGNPALHFDGIQSYVDTGFDEHLLNWTVTAWVKGDHSPDSTKDAGPIMKQKNYMITWDHTSDTFRGAATVCVKGKWYAAGFGALEPNVWYYLTATYDGETLRAFKDGQLITANPDPSGSADDSHYTAKIGRHAKTDEYFAGTVDDVRLYDRALNQNEVAALYGYENN